jgi:hypothetical protein
MTNLKGAGGRNLPLKMNNSIETLKSNGCYPTHMKATIDKGRIVKWLSIALKLMALEKRRQTVLLDRS